MISTFHEAVRFSFAAKRRGRLNLAVVLALLCGPGSLRAGPIETGPAAESALRPWSVPFNPAPAGLVTGLQGFLRTSVGATLVAQVSALGVLTRLDPASEAHRRLVGALGLPDAFQVPLQAAVASGDDKALTGALVSVLNAYHAQAADRKIAAAVQGRADEILAAAREGRLSPAQLSEASSELAPFSDSSEKAAGIERMAASARSEGSMEAAIRTAAALLDQSAEEAPSSDDAFAVRAIERMAQDGRDMSESFGALKQVSNRHQLDAIEVLIDHGYQVADKLPAILQFSNAHQTAALKSMVENDRDVRPSLDAIATFDNEHQAAAVELLASSDDNVSRKIDEIAEIRGPLPVAALGLMIEHERLIEPSLSGLVRLSNEHQLRALEILLDAPITYRIADKIEHLLDFDGPSQTEALEALVRRGLPVRWVLAALPRADTPERARLIQDMAAHLARPVPPDTKASRIADQALSLSFWAGLLALVAMKWALSAVLLGAAGVGMFVLHRRARLSAEAAREANRRSLNSHPEIERVFGPLEDPEMLSPRA